MKPISDSVYGKLMAQGLRAGSVGAGRAGIERPDAALQRAHRQVPAKGREEGCPVHVGGMETGKDADRGPRQVYREVNNRAGETTLQNPEVSGSMTTTAMSQWRVIRIRPSLMIADGGRA